MYSLWALIQARIQRTVWQRVSCPHRFSWCMHDCVHIVHESHSELLGCWWQKIQCLCSKKTEKGFVIGVQCELCAQQKVSESLTCRCEAQCLFNLCFTLFSWWHDAYATGCYSSSRIWSKISPKPYNDASADTLMSVLGSYIASFCFQIRAHVNCWEKPPCSFRVHIPTFSVFIALSVLHSMYLATMLFLVPTPIPKDHWSGKPHPPGIWPLPLHTKTAPPLSWFADSSSGTTWRVLQPSLILEIEKSAIRPYSQPIC